MIQMPCDSITCKSRYHAKMNGIIHGRRIMIGETYCEKEQRKLTLIEADSPLAPEWCPKGIDKRISSAAKEPKAKAAAKTPDKMGVTPPIPAKITAHKADYAHELVTLLNKYRHEYYNLNAPSVSDEVYNRRFDELRRLEEETGYIMSNSPTQTVGFKAVSELEKTAHSVPLLSLDDTKLVDDLLNFAGTQQILIMHKLDGLTVKLEYENGELIRASTRGDGHEGEVITHNVNAIAGIPQSIPYKKRLEVIGEAYICPSDFETLKNTLLDSTGKPYRNARNLASGSVRCYNAADCVKRLVRFTPFNVREGLDEDPIMANSKFVKLNHLKEFGFSQCGYLLVTKPLTQDLLQEAIDELRKSAETDDVPIDGLVLTYNDINFSKTCGSTGHHYKDGIAFKFEDDLHETVLRSIEWNVTRFGTISCVAIFDPATIDGCEITRASLHNLTFIKKLELAPGCRILVSKRNMIIPHVEDNLDRGNYSDSIIPTACPCCGQPTRIEVRTVENKEVERLRCDNPECEAQTLRKFVHFVSKKAMDIEGLSGATLEQFMERGWLETFIDIYRLDNHRDEIVQIEGYGEKSFDNLWEAIQASRNTTFDRYVISMDIPMIGRRASAKLSTQFGGSLDAFEAAVDAGYDFAQFSGFGSAYHSNIHSWFKKAENRLLWKELQTLMNIPNTTSASSAAPAAQTSGNSVFAGKTIVATGKLEGFTRHEINAKITSLNAVAGDTVTKSTDYLICGEKAGSKLAKAKSYGITVLTLERFLEMAVET